MSGLMQLPALSLCNQHAEIFLMEGMGEVRMEISDLDAYGSPSSIAVYGMFAQDMPLCTRVFLAEHLVEVTDHIGNGPNSTLEQNHISIQKTNKGSAGPGRRERWQRFYFGIYDKDTHKYKTPFI